MCIIICSACVNNRVTVDWYVIEINQIPFIWESTFITSAYQNYKQVYVYTCMDHGQK